MTRHSLLLSAALPLLVAALPLSAHAQVTIDDNQTETVRTSDPDGTGNANDTTVTAGTTITIDEADGLGAAVDSDNALTINGTVVSTDLDGTTGVLVEGGRTGSFQLGGSIALTETYTRETDQFGLPEGRLAEGTGRTGILIGGGGTVTGDLVTSGGTTVAVTTDRSTLINVEGNDSYGVRLMADTSVINNIELGGDIAVTGDRSRGVSIEGDIDGNLRVTGSTRVRGEDAVAIAVEGDLIDGGITIANLISSSAYSFSGRQSANLRALLDEDDRFQGGPALLVMGDVGLGINLTTVNNITGQLAVNGSAPAMLIMGEDSDPITVGSVPGTLAFAVINGGAIQSSGDFNDIDSTAIEVGNATLTGGILNTGTVQAFAYENGVATGLNVVDGGVVERFNNAGLFIIRGQEDGDANNETPTPINVYAVNVEAGGSLESIFNSSALTARADGREGSVYAIRDASGTLTLVDNVGIIQAIALPLDEDDATNFNLVAIDASANTSGFMLVQRAATDENGDPILDADGNIASNPIIGGDILLGSGDDVVDIRLGAVIGDVAFGDGQDILSLTGGAALQGDISDSDGQLIILVEGSSLGLTGGQPLAITSASFDATSELQTRVNPNTQSVTTLAATGEVSFEDGALITPTLSAPVGDGGVFTIVDAGTLTINGSLDSLANVDEAPYLYNTAISLDPNNPNALLLTLDLRTPAELGLDNQQAAAFTGLFEGLTANEALGGAFVSITEQDEFFQAYNQIMPDYSVAALQFVLANVDGSVGAVGTHLDNLRRDEVKGGGVWLQEFSYFADRELSGLSEQYRGFGFGFTGGLDAAIGPFDAVGINATFASTEIEDVLGIDDPLEVTTFQLGSYAGWSRGNFSLGGFAGAGYNSFESNREISIGNFGATTMADWTGLHYAGSVRGAYDAQFGKWFVRPSVSFDYLRLQEDGYSETGGGVGVDLTLEERTSENLSATGMVNFGRKFNFSGNRSWWAPSFRVGYRAEFADDPITQAYLSGISNPFTMTRDEFPNQGVLVGFSLAGGSNYSTLGLDYDADIRDGFIRHTGRIVVRLLF